MTDQTLEGAFRDFVKVAVTATDPGGNLLYPAFKPAKQDRTFSFYTSDEAGTFKLPNMSFELPESAALHANTEVSQGTLTIWTETQVDDETLEIHTARCDALDEILKDKPAVIAAINAAGKVKIFGYATGRMTRKLQERHWSSGLDLSVGYGPPAPPA